MPVWPHLPLWLAHLTHCPATLRALPRLPSRHLRPPFPGQSKPAWNAWRVNGPTSDNAAKINVQTPEVGQGKRNEQKQA